MSAYETYFNMLCAKAFKIYNRQTNWTARLHMQYWSEQTRHANYKKNQNLKFPCAGTTVQSAGAKFQSLGTEKSTRLDKAKCNSNKYGIACTPP